MTPGLSKDIQYHVQRLRRPLRTRINLLDPSSEARVLDQQINQVLNHSGGNIEFEEGDKVLVRDYSQNKGKWIQAIVTNRTTQIQIKGSEASL